MMELIERMRNRGSGLDFLGADDMLEAADALERMQWNPDMEVGKKAGWIMLFSPCEHFPTNDMTHWIGKWRPHYDDVGGWIDQDDALVLHESDPTKWMHLPPE